MSKFAFSLATATLIAGSASAATFDVFTDRALFEAALTGPVTLETFDAITEDVSFAGGSATVGGLTIIADDDGSFGNSIIDAPPVQSEIDGNGTTALNIFTSSVFDAAIEFASPILAVGADFFNFNDGQLRTEIDILGETFTPDITAAGSLNFFGVISDTPFTRVDFEGVNNDVFGIDNVTSAQATDVPTVVPLPASLPFLVLGVVGFGLLRRRKS
ncbi:VPLPA-CTERM sorting domain-containing protein [uncultured Roseobacter sp.]|uniref:VPLPA-CTERM sorting domain-containing protein n=1 Tax=uncultured Roseobacter sp. TaxID=114847 RepID=UPI0026096782|nr:VPLPA-CTERM sorting domain-containing protein [uncultured Roseobacter sp.]